MMRKRLKQAGIPEPASAYGLRRTFISDLLAAGAGIATVKVMSGHANIPRQHRHHGAL